MTLTTFGLGIYVFLVASAAYNVGAVTTTVFDIFHKMYEDSGDRTYNKKDRYMALGIISLFGLPLACLIAMCVFISDYANDDRMLLTVASVSVLLTGYIVKHKRFKEFSLWN